MVYQAPDDGGPLKPSERLPAVWPWLLIPLVALALFFALNRVRSEQSAPPTDQPAQPVTSADGSATNVR
jgi:hypothetical protein